MNQLRSLSKICKERPICLYLLLVVFLYSINFHLLFINNNSWFFNFDILDKYGDQNLYIDLAGNLIKKKFIPHVYSVGFPLFLVPFLAILKTVDWEIITKFLVPIQSFLILPIVWVLIFSLFKFARKNGRKFLPLLIPLVLILYELFVLYNSEDPLTFYLFFGLIPYSEPLAILVLVLLYYLLIKTNASSLKVFLAIGMLAGFVISVRIIFIVLVIPIVFYGLMLIWSGKYKPAAFLALGSVMGYLPQIFYNYKAYGKIIYVGYNWYWELKLSKYTPVIKKLYGNNAAVSQFHIQYLKVNLFALMRHYVQFIIIAFINIGIIFYKRKRIVGMNKMDLFFLLSNFSALIYIAIYLSYWWSLNKGCIDRFLLPLVFFSLINFYYSIHLLNESK